MSSIQIIVIWSGGHGEEFSFDLIVVVVRSPRMAGGGRFSRFTAQPIGPLFRQTGWREGNDDLGRICGKRLFQSFWQKKTIYSVTKFYEMKAHQ